MVSSVEKEKILNTKLQVLKAVTRSKAEKKSGILMDAVTYIDQLKKQIDEMTKEYAELMTEIPTAPETDLEQVVKVEKLEDSGFAVKITCEKTKDLLISMIEAFENMGLEIVQADIDTSEIFDLEAVMETADETLEADDITEAIYDVMEDKGLMTASSDDED